MNTRTYSVTVPAPKSRVFAYLADIANLPEWATSFCQGVEVIDGQHWVTTPGGDKVACDIRSHQPTGTIDFFSGPSADKMERYPARVLDLPDGESLYLFTTIQAPGLSDAEFEAQGTDVQTEFANIVQVFAALVV